MASSRELTRSSLAQAASPIIQTPSKLNICGYKEELLCGRAMITSRGFKFKRRVTDGSFLLSTPSSFFSRGLRPRVRQKNIIPFTSQQLEHQDSHKNFKINLKAAYCYLFLLLSLADTSFSLRSWPFSIVSLLRPQSTSTVFTCMLDLISATYRPQTAD